MTKQERAKTIADVNRDLKSGHTLHAALFRHHVTSTWWARWSPRFESAGLDGLDDMQRTGRPPKILFSEAAKEFARKIYMKTNLRRDAGSMTCAWRLAAKMPDSPLTPEERAAILDVGNKHNLPQDAKRALRVGKSVVARYRDPKAGQNDGIYTPGFLRMATDGTRRLLPGERQVWDDASVNFGVVVPWARGGDKCSEKFQCRVARFQLLLGIDCATDMCVGYSYVMRNNDAYNASDVCASLLRCWRGNGYAPDEIVLEGGAWQAQRTIDMMGAAGVQIISAKGRPNQKLVEGWFNRAWTPIGSFMPGGDVGRFRGEMASENKLWMSCREGREDPRKHFPCITDFLAGLDKTIMHLNTEISQSKIYGNHIPAEQYAEQQRLGHAIPDGLVQYGLPVREVRTIFRGGLIQVTACSPFGFNFPYLFAMKEGYLYDGAKALVAFDPADIQAGAVVELAERFQEWPKGHVIDSAAGCISAAPMIWHAADGAWTAGTLDARAEAKMIKRGSRALIGAKAAAFDERGVKAKVAVDDKSKTAFALGNVTPVIREEEEQQEPDWAKLERDALFA
jgi:hypothetical protein